MYIQYYSVITSLCIQNVNTTIRKRMKARREEWITDQCDQIDSGLQKGNSRLAFQLIKKITKKPLDKVSAVQDKHGHLLTEDEKIMKRWTEYCKDLYNYKINPASDILETKFNDESDTGNLIILPEEVESAIHHLKNGKSPGVDNIPAELLKHGGPEVVSMFTTICQGIWDSKKWPNLWTQSLIIPLPKESILSGIL